MEIVAMRNIDLGMNNPVTTGTGTSPNGQMQSPQPQALIKTPIQSPQQQINSEKEIPQDKKNKKEISGAEAQELTVEMNKFMQLLHADIKFVLHEKTQTLIVQVVDSKEQKVLKEFPPHEMLDIKAKIREQIGILLDKRV